MPPFGGGGLEKQSEIKEVKLSYSQDKIQE